MLSRNDIIEKVKNGSLEIYPLDEKNLTGIGYNLSTTYFVFSITRGELLPVKEEITARGKEHYVEVPPADTVLFFTREYIAVDNTLSGTFHSKVACVCQGFGHVSTTLDPTWQGQLIISVNNPTKRFIRLDLDRSGNIATMLLYELDTDVTGPDIHDNNKGRCDLLLSRFVDPPKDVRAREKYLQLREFVMDRYADSLNGRDDFLRGDVLPDRFSKIESQLKALRLRLSSDCAFLVNDEYLSSDGCSLTPLLNDEEEELINTCSYVQICGDCNGCKMDALKESIAIVDDESKKKALKRARSCIRAIDYELKTIDHSRRVEWQNSMVLGFASEDSELAKAQERSRRKRITKRRRSGIIAFAAVASLSILIAAAGFINWGSWQIEMQTAMITGGIAGAVSSLVPLVTWMLRISEKNGVTDDR